MTRFVVIWKYYDFNIGVPMLNCEQIFLRIHTYIFNMSVVIRVS